MRLSVCVFMYVRTRGSSCLRMCVSCVCVCVLLFARVCARVSRVCVCVCVTCACVSELVFARVCVCVSLLDFVLSCV